MMSERAAVLKAMHSIVICMNDENAYMRWIYIVPDELSDDDFEYIAENDELYEEAVNLFCQLCQTYLRSGLFIAGNLYGTTRK